MKKLGFNFNNFRIANIFFYCFPILMLAGPAAINISLLIILIFFLKDLNKLNIYSNKIFITLFIFWIYITSLSFFSDDILLSLKTSFSQIKFYSILFFLFIFLDLNNPKIQNKAFLLWSIIILFVCIDTNYQNLNGYDFFGFKAEGYSNVQGKFFLDKQLKIVGPTDPYYLNLINETTNTDRLSGPFGSELIVGAYLSKISPFLFYYFTLNYKNFNLTKKIYSFFILTFILQTILISGERTAFLIILIIYFFSIMVLFKKKLFKFFSIIFIIILSLFIFSSDFEKNRYNDAIKILKNYKDSSYGRLAFSSINIFNQNIFFGVGVKGYRLECYKLEDTVKNNPHPMCSSHPHNGPLELLSETGLIGTSIFLIFFILLLRKVFYDYYNQNLNSTFFLSSNFIFLILPFMYLLPVVPNGSLFTSWNGSFFWFSLGLILSLSKKTQTK